MERGLTARRVAIALAAAVAVLVAGTIGFHRILHESWLEAFYRAVVTSSLTGLDTVPRDHAGLVLSMVLVACGVTIFAFAGAAVVETIARGVFTGTWAERRRRRAIENLRDHTIICGYGRVGRRIAEEFRRARAPFVVLDVAPEASGVAAEVGDMFLQGDATEDEDLHAAGLERAKALIAALDSDADNLYIVLSARAARPDLMLVARASDDDAEKKLQLAGADRVVMPYRAAGRVIAGLVLRPQVAAFLNTATSTDGSDLRFEQIEVPKACAVIGRSIRDIDVHGRTGASIIAVAKRGREFHTRPAPETILEEGDILIGVGTSEEIRALEDLFAPSDNGR